MQPLKLIKWTSVITCTCIMKEENHLKMIIENCILV